ncbi:DNA-binding protein WhiA [Bacillota bacterium Meth-B3]
MSFSVEARKEAARVPCEKRCCALAELSGAALGSGALTFKGPGRYALSLSVGGAFAAERYLRLFKRFLHCDCLMAAVKSSRLGGQVRYEVSPPENELPRVLKALKLLDKDQPFGMRSVPAPELIQGECCKQAFLRGLFLAGGSTGDPRRSYHFEIAVGDEALAACAEAVLLSFGLPARRVQRKAQWVVYLKDGEHMATALALIGAHQAMLQLENVRIVKDLRNEANRQANCDSANVDKALAAAEQQLSVIEVIDRQLGVEALPEPLRDVAELRVRFPDASLAELGGMLTPALGKSGVKARMRKLEALAEELVNG